MKKKKYKVLVPALPVAALLGACLEGCDTRESIYEDVREWPQVVVEFEDGSRDTLWVENGSASSEVRMEVLGIRGDSAYVRRQRIGARLLFDGKENGARMDELSGESEGTIGSDGLALVGEDFKVGYGKHVISERDGGEPETIASQKYAYSFDMPEDDEVHLYLYLRAYGLSRPVTELEVRPVEGRPLERVLDLGGSSLCDGDVVKYEWCIDGEVLGDMDPGLDSDSLHSGGAAAYGGTYVTATAQKSITHAFQEAGDHEVYYRCMGSNGVWDWWHKEKVTIKDK